MQRVLFILSVAAMGIAPGSSLMTGQQALESASKEVILKGGSIAILHELSVNCTNEGIINRGFYPDDINFNEGTFCVVCTCGQDVTDLYSDCNRGACSEAYHFDIPENVRNSWKNNAVLSEFKSVAASNLYQVYQVSDGICYVGELQEESLKQLKCFTSPSYKSQ